jgi:hypothetical protein
MTFLAGFLTGVALTLALGWAAWRLFIAAQGG